MIQPTLECSPYASVGAPEGALSNIGQTDINEEESAERTGYELQVFRTRRCSHWRVAVFRARALLLLHEKAGRQVGVLYAFCG